MIADPGRISLVEAALRAGDIEFVEDGSVGIRVTRPRSDLVRRLRQNWPTDFDVQAALNRVAQHGDTEPVAAAQPQAVTFSGVNPLDRSALRRGPLVMYWGQPAPVVVNLMLRWPDRPPISLRERLRGVRPWKVQLRLAPPDGVTLAQWLPHVAARLGVTVDTPAANASVVHLPLAGRGRFAVEALEVVAAELQRLEGVQFGSAQVRVDPWR